MGAWGIGLYQSDFALDLKETVKGVTRLPFETDKLLELICSEDPEAANDAKDEDHTIFWLVVADQFAKRGIDCEPARDRALAIIADGADLATMAALGMGEKDLAKRRSMLEKLQARLTVPIEPTKSRKVLKAPQKLLFELGEVLIYPVCKGEPINPYAVGKDWEWVKAWQQDGWGALLVAERGRVFDFLAWYSPLVICEPLPAEPRLADLAEPRMWVLRHPGTLSARHYANMQMKSLGCVPIDAPKFAHFFHAPFAHFFPGRGSEIDRAVNDISLANEMNLRPPETPGYLWEKRLELGHPPPPRINALGDIVDIRSMDAWPRAETAQLSLSGLWRGTYRYLGADKPPGSFTADLSEADGRLSGEIRDDIRADDAPEKPSHAIVEGSHVGRDVRFLKRYMRENKRYVPLQYFGKANESATEVEGRWFLPGRSSGEFVMVRAEPGEG
jgi:hypothetical protein